MAERVDDIWSRLRQAAREDTEDRSADYIAGYVSGISRSIKITDDAFHFATPIFKDELIRRLWTAMWGTRSG